MINQDSPIIQNMCGVPNMGTPPYYPNGFTPQYNLNPVDRFNSIQQQQQQNMIQPFGTLGYNPNQMQNLPHPSAIENGINPLLQSYDPSIAIGPNMMNNSAFSRVGARSNPYNINNQQPVADITYNVEYGWNPSGAKYMVSADYDEKLDDLKRRINIAQEEYNNTYSYSIYSYYNMNNNGINPYVLSKFSSEIKALEQEHINNRINFNKKLSKAAHIALGDEMPDDEIDLIYDSKQIPNTNTGYSEFDIVTHNINSMRPINYYYEDQQYYYANNKITKEHNDSLGNCKSLKDFLDNAGNILLDDLLEESNNKKKDKSKTYNTGNEYQQYLATQLQSRDGRVPDGLYSNLYSSGSVNSDGSLNIKVPEFLQNKKIESEHTYAEDRAKFIQSIYNPVSLL